MSVRANAVGRAGAEGLGGGREIAVRSGIKVGAGGEEEGESTDEKHSWKDGVWTSRKNDMQRKST